MRYILDIQNGTTMDIKTGRVVAPKDYPGVLGDDFDEYTLSIFPMKPKEISGENARAALAEMGILVAVEDWAKSVNEAAYQQFWDSDVWHYGNAFIEAAIVSGVISREQVDAIFEGRGA